MKHRITLTMDPEISHRAKRLAKEQGTSFSALVEDLLAERVKQSNSTPEMSFADKWRGKFTLTDRDDPRTKRLKKKYGLESQ